MCDRPILDVRPCGRAPAPGRRGLAVGAVIIAAVLAGPSRTPFPAGAQGPTPTESPTAVATPTPAPPPPPSIAGRWSITRTWYRRCPGCGAAVTLTTPWTIEQAGSAVRVDRGPRGAVVVDASGNAWLALEGLEQGATSTFRFWYASLRVAGDGNGFEGAFDGSEHASNPCGERPPTVTCFASVGWIRGRRLDAAATATPPATDTPSAAATASPTATPPPAPTAASPTATVSASPTATAATPTSTSTPTAAPTARATARSGTRCWLPSVSNDR